MFLADSVTGEVVRYLTDGGLSYMPVPSHDGASVFHFQTDDLVEFRIVDHRLEGDTTETLFSGRFPFVMPVASPDGQYLEGEVAANHVSGEPLPAGGILAADPVVHREAGVTPVEHAFSESGIQHALGAEEIEQLVAQRLTECRFRQRRQHPEGSGEQEHAVGDQGVNVRIEGDEIAEGEEG